MKPKRNPALWALEKVEALPRPFRQPVCMAVMLGIGAAAFLGACLLAYGVQAAFGVA